MAGAPVGAIDPVTAGWEALGTSVVVRVAEPSALDLASRQVESELLAIDAAASRFRPDSELAGLNAAGGRMLGISRLLLEALEAGIRAALLTDGAVDPTLGDALVLSGYTSDWHELEPPPADHDWRRRAVRVVRARRARAWEGIDLRREPPGARLPIGVRVDLGATAKALAADRAALAAAAATGVGVLVSLGGDIATAGAPPPSGWLVRVTDDHRSPASAAGQTIAIHAGGLATSSTTVRRWTHAGRVMHHILDPGDGEPVTPVWRTASVAADSCLDANIASTAAIVLGRAAPGWLAHRGLPARLVWVDGRVETLGDWPADERPSVPRPADRHAIGEAAA